MAFLAPLIPLALGAAFPALGATATALLSAGIGVGLSFLSNRLRPKQKGSGPSGVQVGLRIDTNPPRQVIIGKTATGGSLAFWHLSGANNDKLWMVIALADHECTALDNVIVAKKVKSWNSGTGEVADYSGKLKVRFYSGAAGQTADAALVAAAGGRWTSNCVGTSVCYVVVEADYDEKLFPEGIPELGFIVRGAKLYDPRTATTIYSDNPAVAIYNILRGITVGGQKLLGMNVPADAIRLSEAQAAANACDELVSLKAGGTEKRYTCGVVLDCDLANRDIIETLLASMAGEVIETGGIYRIMSGVAQTAVANLTDDDFIIDQPFSVRPKKGRNEIINAVYGSYSDPARLYTQVPLPPRTSSTDETADGGIRLSSTLDLVAVTSRTQAQRVMEVERKRGRRMGSAASQLRAGRFILEPGDWITVTSARRGFVSKPYSIETISGAIDLRSDIALVEMDDAIDDWIAASDEIDDDQVIDLPPAGPTFSTVSGIVLVNTTIAGSGTQQRPGLRITWTPVTDPTVVRLTLQYRKVGDTTAIERTISDPSSGSYDWLDGVQGDIEYEARLLPVTLPERATTWSSWVAPGASSADQIVAAAEIADAVPPDTITVEMLSAQARLELQLTTALASVKGSVNERVEEAIRIAREAAAGAMGVALENTRQIRSVRATNAENSIGITEVLEAINGPNGLAAQWSVSIDVNGMVTGLVTLSGDLNYTVFGILADKFWVAKPDGSGAKQIITVGTVNGVTEVGIDAANLIIDGSILARHLSVVTLDAISADVGVLTAGLIKDAANTYNFNLATGLLGRTDGTFKIDMLNKEFEITF